MHLKNLILPCIRIYSPGIYNKFLDLFTLLYLKRNMSVFAQQLNPITGEYEWNPQREDYDYKQEVARSAYADMLHDSERNEKYFEALRRCISILRQQGKCINVLDIGTGTGLLSMMALSLGADTVTACEAFPPMAECARKIFRVNGYEEKLHLVGKRSTELEVGPNKDMLVKANLLVAEVFDTELIGEGAIETFLHAKEHLLTEDALIVPSAGTIYAQVVSSEMMRRWNNMTPVIRNDRKGEFQMLLEVPKEVTECPGAAAVHDLQMSEISSDWFTPVSDPIPVFKFDWTGRTLPLLKNQFTESKFKALCSGMCDVVFMWWDLQMDPCGNITLSCAPVWEHPLTKGKANVNSSKIPWRDHWMQAVYYFPQTVCVNSQDSLTLSSAHDEYSLWFSLQHKSSDSIIKERPICECGLHVVSSRTRLGQLNDARRRNLYIRVLEKYVKDETVCLALGSFPYLGIIAAKLGARHVYLHETNPSSVKLLRRFLQINGIEDRVTILTSKLENITLEASDFQKATLVLSEPNFSTSLLPWHSLQFLYLLQFGRHLIADDAVVLPSMMSLKGLPVHFRDLWKIRAPLNTCCNFDLTIFDELIEKASDEADENVEPQPLWEYPSVALGLPQTLLTVPVGPSLPVETVSEISILSVEGGVLNGVALWVDWHFGPNENDILTTGPIDAVTVGNKVIWDMYTRQGIHLFKQHTEKTASNCVEVHSEVEFNPVTGKVNFNFEVRS